MKINVRVFAYIKINAYLCNVVKTKDFILRWGQHHKFCNIIMATSIFGEVKIKEKINTKKYCIYYWCGFWHPRRSFYAECDAEAIFDADIEFANSRLKDWKHDVALFCGNRKVKQYVWGEFYGK